MAFQQRDIVTVNFPVPNVNGGIEFKPHSVVIVSGQILHDIEDDYYLGTMITSTGVDDDMSFFLGNGTTVPNMREPNSQVRRHLMATFRSNQIQTRIGYLTLNAFKQLKERMIECLFEN